MGASKSRIIESELRNMEGSHSLRIDPELQRTQRPLLSKFEGRLKLGFVPRHLWGVYYDHYMIVDSRNIFEFGDGTCEDLQVRIYPGSIPAEFHLEKEFAMTEQVRGRMAALLGATSFSLALRNSEHAAKYIQSGTWYSLQMTGRAALHKALKGALQDKAALVNTPPQELQKPAEVSTAPLYPQWYFRSAVVEQPQFLRHSPTFEPVPGTEDLPQRNILILGPTGAGKSSLVNLLYNQRVAKVKNSAYSVTRQMEVYQGVMQVPTGQFAINVIDSVGFCDSVIPPDEVMRLAKNFVKTNCLSLSKVVIVCAGRIEAQQAAAIKAFMKWLKYDRYKSSFAFIYNKAEDLDDAEKIECVGQMCELLGADPHHRSYMQISDDMRVSIQYAVALGVRPNAAFPDVEDAMRTLYFATIINRQDREELLINEKDCLIL